MFSAFDGLNLSAPIDYGATRKAQRNENDNTPPELIADHFVNWVRRAYSFGNNRFLNHDIYDPFPHYGEAYDIKLVTFWLGGQLEGFEIPGFAKWAILASDKATQGINEFNKLQK
jgi:hypothetical protein